MESKLQTRPPDWEFWLNMPSVKVWQACALSLNIDPDSMRHSPHGWMAGPGSGPIFEPGSFPNNEAAEAFGKRLRLLSASITNPAYFRLRSLIMGDASRCEIYLSEFATWATSVVRWKDMPAELGESAQTKKSTDDPAVCNQVNDKTDDIGNDNKEWMNAARKIAGEYIERHKKQKLFPSQDDVCTHLEQELRTKKIYGPQKRPLSKATILREAIQGEWWTKNKPS